VSLLTLSFGYTKALIGLVILDGVTLFAEFWWIQVVYNRFPALHVQKKKQSSGHTSSEHGESQGGNPTQNESFWSDWIEFASMPIFYGRFASSIGSVLTWYIAALAQGLTWLTTLDFGQSSV